MIIEIHADLLESQLPAIGHGVNVQGVMGAGIAKGFAERYPDMLAAYRRLCAEGSFPPGNVFMYDTGDTYVVNLASQEYPGPDARIEWITSALVPATTYLHSVHVNVLGIPRIGCGIGGLEWSDVKTAISKTIAALPFQFTVVVCNWP